MEGRRVIEEGRGKPCERGREGGSEEAGERASEGGDEEGRGGEGGGERGGLGLTGLGHARVTTTTRTSNENQRPDGRAEFVAPQSRLSDDDDNDDDCN